MTPQYTCQLVHFLHQVTPEILLPEVLDRARFFFLDYLSVAIRGSQEESAKCVQRMIQRIDAPGPASVLGTSIRTLPGFAAFANGTASHGIEMDDTHSGGSIHLGTTMYSVALAIAELTPEISSAALLAAVVAGFEAAARIAMAVQPQEQYALGFHPTPACGVFGAAITAAKLFDLTEEQTLAAVGITGSMAAGSMEFLAEGAWTKRIHPGLAAQNGIQAAMLAAEGFTGPRRILEGRDGFLHAYSRHAVPERLTAGLGDSYEILHNAVKPHSCCRYMQGPIDAILEIIRENRLAEADIAKIEIAILEAGWNIICEPREQKYNPESVVDAQFSMPFGAAVAVLHGRAGLDEFTLEQVRSPSVAKVMDKVTLVRDTSIEQTFPREWPARVTIQGWDGQTHEKFVRYPKGDPENPLSWSEMGDKFRALAGRVLPADRCERIIQELATAQPAALAALCSYRDVS
jgi:2-methylcitrate dehydratase PrpD